MKVRRWTSLVPFLVQNKGKDRGPDSTVKCRPPSKTKKKKKNHLNMNSHIVSVSFACSVVTGRTVYKCFTSTGTRVGLVPHTRGGGGGKSGSRGQRRGFRGTGTGDYGA